MGRYWVRPQRRAKVPSTIQWLHVLPEQEDVEWHSDRIPLSTDPNGLQDARVSQLAADQLVLKHAWLLSADAHVSQWKKQRRVITDRTQQG